jgi:hypothetical protein
MTEQSGAQSVDDIWEMVSNVCDSLNEMFGGLKLTVDGRRDLAVAALHVAIEHFKAIVNLTEDGLLGSAAALVRLEYESVLRGIWLAKAATDDQVAAYEKDDVPLVVNMVEAIDKLDGGNHWMTLHKPGYRALSGLSHSGIGQLSRRYEAGAIGSNYSDAFVSEMLVFVAHLGIVAMSELASQCHDNGLQSDLLEIQRSLPLPPAGA